MDYDGQYQDGTPLTTVTEYTGVAGEAGVGYAAGMRSGASEPTLFIAHAGVERWQRNITGSGGYEEEYQITYLRLGVEQNAPRGGWTARGGLFWPLAVQEQVDILDGIPLEPDGRTTFYFGLGYRWRSGLEAAFNYQSYRFKASDPVAADWNGDGVDDGYVYQPRSELDTYGISLRYNY